MNCGKDISDRGNRAIRCSECQIKKRKRDKINDARRIDFDHPKSRRTNKYVYQKTKLYETYSIDELSIQVTILRSRLMGVKYYTKEWYNLRTLIRICTELYSKEEMLGKIDREVLGERMMENYDDKIIDYWEKANNDAISEEFNGECLCPNCKKKGLKWSYSELCWYCPNCGWMQRVEE